MTCTIINTHARTHAPHLIIFLHTSDSVGTHTHILGKGDSSLAAAAAAAAAAAPVAAAAVSSFFAFLRFHDFPSLVRPFPLLYEDPGYALLLR